MKTHANTIYEIMQLRDSLRLLSEAEDLMQQNVDKRPRQITIVRKSLNPKSVNAAGSDDQSDNRSMITQNTKPKTEIGKLELRF